MNRSITNTFYKPLICIVALLLAGGVTSAPTFAAGDLSIRREIGAMTISPDGRWMVWDQRETDITSNRTRTRVWVLDLQHPGEPRPLFPDDDYNVHQPRFGADGEWIYFLSDASGADQLWRTPTNETAAEQVSDFIAPITSYSVAATGNQVQIWADLPTPPAR